MRVVDQEHWDELFYRYDILQSRGQDVTKLAGSFPLEGVNCVYTRVSDNREWFLQQLRIASGSDAQGRAEQEYSWAWLGYVNQVRQKQLDLFDTLVKTEMTRREEKRAAIAPPEVPPQLLP